MFAERLKGLRKKAGYTASEFASEIYMDTRSILKWEKGFILPSLLQSVLR
jgi:transcriptional regulator with XRE-family HTH domain